MILLPPIINDSIYLLTIIFLNLVLSLPYLSVYPCFAGYVLFWVQFWHFLGCVYLITIPYISVVSLLYYLHILYISCPVSCLVRSNPFIMISDVTGMNYSDQLTCSVSVWLVGFTTFSSSLETWQDLPPIRWIVAFPMGLYQYFLCCITDQCGSWSHSTNYLIVHPLQFYEICHLYPSMFWGVPSWICPQILSSMISGFRVIMCLSISVSGGPSIFWWYCFLLYFTDQFVTDKWVQPPLCFVHMELSFYVLPCKLLTWWRLFKLVYMLIILIIWWECEECN